MNYEILLRIVAILLAAIGGYSQVVPDGDTKLLINRLSLSAQKFGLDLLSHVSEKAEEVGRDIIISPFSVWSLLLLMLEASSGETYLQLRKTLHIDMDDNDIRSSYRNLLSNLSIQTTNITISSLQALYVDVNVAVNDSYRETLRSYGVQPKSINFGKSDTYKIINEEARRATHGLIKNTILPQDIFGANIFILSSVYFKGQWKFPFNSTFNKIEPFYNEVGEIVDNVHMMSQEGEFSYATSIEGLDAYVLEMPYGLMDRLSMFTILPKRGFTLQNVIQNLNKLGLSRVMDAVASNGQKIKDAKIEVHMPKFVSSTDLTLNSVLKKMGIKDLFTENRADLSKLSKGLFVDLCVHSTKIIVNEEGTEASAASAAVLVDKSTPLKFYLNKPFQYFIVDKYTSIPLFAGQVRYPVNA